MSRRTRVLLSAALALAIPATLEAQTAREMREARLAMRDSLRATQERLRRYIAERTVLPSNSDSVAGLVYRYPASLIDDRDRTTLAEGIEAARRRLRAQFGVTADSLVRRIQWDISAPTTQAQAARVLMVTGARQPDGSQPRVLLSVPVRKDRVEAAVLQDAARALAASNPQLWRFAGTAFALLPDDRRAYVVYRELSTKGTPDTRRCLQGAADACAAAMGVAMPGAGASRGPLQPQLSVRLRGDLLSFVLETRGGEALAVLLRGEDAMSGQGPIAVLAQAAALSQAELIAAWRESLASAPARNAAVQPGLMAIALFWSLLFGFLSALRRPR